MQGWKLSHGQITNPNITEMEIWHYFNVLFSTQSKNQSSYKYGLIRALVENLYNVDPNLVLSYDQLYYTFARIYWNLIIGHHLRQTDSSHERSAIERVLYAIQAKYDIPEGLTFDSLKPNIQLEILRDVKAQGKKYVVGAVWGDTEGSFYEFSRVREYLQFNPPVYRFLQRYHQVILRLNNYEWAKFLAKNNSIPADLISAIETVTQRNNLSPYLRILEHYTDDHCFYCGKSFGHNKPHVDHFIPWSYIHSDNLWNLVLACSGCNLSKNDRLAVAEYLIQIQERNLQLQQFAVTSINEEFATYSPQKFTDLYQYAAVNGFDANWRPKGVDRNPR